MKFSKSWLLQHVDIAVGTAELVERLTMAGLEVGGVEPAAPGFSGVVVGEIEALDPHPDADQLRICRVRGSGDQRHQVVCGAPNAALGLKAPFAEPGARLPDGLEIQAVRLRGVESRGMLCSAAELGLSGDDQGLLALDPALAVGVDLRAALDLDDEVIEVELTPNRGDCLSIRGLAREAAAVLGGTLRDLPIPPIAPTIDDCLRVELLAGSACPRYAGRVIRGLDPAARTPQWLHERLRRAGLRAIHPVVDVTNYVMLELGQPMHGFDLAAIQGGIQVRFARPGEVLALLDGSELVAADGATLVVADAQRPLALAGILGGRDSGVQAATRDVFLESAHFDPLVISGKARQLGVQTDSSHRFARGVDPELTRVALERATALLLEIAGGRAGPIQMAAAGPHPPPVTVMLRRGRLAQQLGVDIPPQRVTEILSCLGLELVAKTDDGWQFRIPSWRFDLGIEADLVEEVARIYGYNELPAAMPALAPELGAPPPARVQELSAALVHRGYREAICYSFVPPEVVALVCGEPAGVAVANPISAAMSVMRPSLWPGLLLAARHNLNRQAGRLRLFEAGLRFGNEPGFGQQMTLAGLIAGDLDPESWANSRQAADFHALKGDVEVLLEVAGVAGQVIGERGAHPALHPGQCLRLSDVRGQLLGYAGALSPVVARQLDLEQPIFLFELFCDRLPGPAGGRFRAPSRFPAVRRDIALVVAREVLAADLLAAARRVAGDHLADLRVFDVYHGEGLENNEKSVAIGLTFQDQERTLTDADVQVAERAVIESLATGFGARLRGE